MPYAPGIQARAGDYFAAIGPQIAQNIQNWRQGREEREQSVATAETLARYLQDDPKGMELFREPLSKIHGMSTGQAKGVIGGVTMYLNQQRLNAADEISRKQLAIQEQDAAARVAERERLARFNEAFGQEVNPPLMFKSAAGAGPPPPDANTVIRAAQRVGALGRPEVTGLINAVGSYDQRVAKEGVDIGKEVMTPSGVRLVGLGRGVTPHVVEPKEPKDVKDSLPFGKVVTTEEGDRLIGMGPGVSPHVVPAKDQKLTTGQQTFLDLAPEYGRQVEEFESLIKKYGSYESTWFGDAKAAARLPQLAYQTAILFSKIVDPESIAREGEVNSAKKYLIPMGPTVPREVTLEALKAQRRDLINAVRTKSAGMGGKLPSNMPEWMQYELGQKGQSPPGASDKTVSITTPQEVGDAVKSGVMTYEEGARILRERFGIKD